MVFRPLCKELQEVATRRLNEDPSRIGDHIRIVREWAQSRPELKIKTDDQWLLTFLRGCKYDHNLVKKKLEYLYTRRANTPEWFSNRDPFLPEIQELLDLGAYLPLPLAHPGAPRVSLARDSADTLKYSVDVKAKLAFMTLDLMLNEDDNSVVVGGHVLGDSKNLTFRHIYHVPFKTALKGYKILTNGYALRARGFYGINVPWYAMTAFNTYKYIASPEVMKLIHIYQNDSLEELHKIVPSSILPEEYGGTAGPASKIQMQWKQKIESFRDWFLAEEREATERETSDDEFVDAEEGNIEDILKAQEAERRRIYSSNLINGYGNEQLARERELQELTENFLGLGALIG